MPKGYIPCNSIFSVPWASLSAAGDRSTILVAPDDGHTVIWCAKCGVRAIQFRRSPIRISVQRVWRILDVYSMLAVHLVSRRVQRLFSESGFTGYEIVPPVDVQPAKPEERLSEFASSFRDEYQVLWTTGQPVSIAEASQLTISHNCAHCGYRAWTVPRVGVIITPSAWNGDDIFQTVELRGPFFVTERVAEALSSLPDSNINLIPAERHAPGAGLPRP